MNIRNYLSLTKPGIVFGNSVTAIGGFILASKGHFDSILFFWMLLGLGSVVAAGCVCNNFFDRDIDEKMERTQSRALVQKIVSPHQALVFASFLLVFGLAALFFQTTSLACFTAAFGFFMYVAVYGYAKRKTHFGTLVGSVSGAIPPVVGYTAVHPSLDLAAFLLFLIVTLWQMPHFYAIAIYRLEDYKAGGIPVLPAVKGFFRTKIEMTLYLIAFIIASLCLPYFGYTGMIYAVGAALLGGAWLWICLQGFKKNQELIPWARRTFFFSLVVIMGLSLLMLDCG